MASDVRVSNISLKIFKREKSKKLKHLFSFLDRVIEHPPFLERNQTINHLFQRKTRIKSKLPVNSTNFYVKTISIVSIRPGVKA